MSSAEVRQILRERWESAKPHVTAAIDHSVSFFEWLLLNWKLVVFNLVVLPVLGIIYWTINSIGLRLTIPALAFKVSKVPGFSALRHYHGWRDLDLAHVAALGLLALVWVFTLLMFHVFMYGGFRRNNANESFVHGFVLTIGAVLVIVDAVMFYNGIGEQGSFFSNDGVSSMQIVLTIAYSATLLAVAFLHTLLENR
jgi:hypothetical protein